MLGVNRNWPVRITWILVLRKCNGVVLKQNTHALDSAHDSKYLGPHYMSGAASVCQDDFQPGIHIQFIHTYSHKLCQITIMVKQKSKGKVATCALGITLK